jgi:hypothetical protein
LRIDHTNRLWRLFQSHDRIDLLATRRQPNPFRQPIKMISADAVICRRLQPIWKSRTHRPMLQSLDPVVLARAQFAFTVSFHFIFPAFSIGLASYLLVLESLWLRTGKRSISTCSAIG